MKKPKCSENNDTITMNSGGSCYELRAIYITSVKDSIVTKAKSVREFGCHAFLAGVAYGRAYPAKGRRK